MKEDSRLGKFLTDHPRFDRFLGDLITKRSYAFARIGLLFFTIQLIHLLILLPFALPNLIECGFEELSWRYETRQEYNQTVKDFENGDFDTQSFNMLRNNYMNTHYMMKYSEIYDWMELLPPTEKKIKFLGKRRITNGAAMQFIVEMRKDFSYYSLSSLEYDEGIECIEECDLFTDEEKAAYIAEAKERKKLN